MGGRKGRKGIFGAGVLFIAFFRCVFSVLLGYLANVWDHLAIGKLALWLLVGNQTSGAIEDVFHHANAVSLLKVGKKRGSHQ